jgi:hypothetical protein
MPTNNEFRRLRSIVWREHPWLRDEAARQESVELQFASAFWACGHFFRTAEPCRTRHFGAFVDEASAILGQHGLEGIGGKAFLSACLAAGDVAWRAAGPGIGQLLEIALDRRHGMRCSNAWRDILNGRALLAPIPAAERLKRAQEALTIRIFQEHHV